MNTYKPNVTGLAELILKSQGGAVAKTLIHKTRFGPSFQITIKPK